MPFFEDTTCPFCGARFTPGASACPACDLPLLGDDGSRPPERERAPFDGASLFDDAFPDEDFMTERLFERPLATEARNQEGSETMRCVVVAMNRSEADMLEDMLRAEGVPCMVRSIGTEIYSMARNRCEVLVPEYALPTARELLRLEAPAQPEPSTPTAAMALLIAAGAIATLLCVAFALTYL